MDALKQARLEEIILEIQRKWGKNAITTAASVQPSMHRVVISTGYASLDTALNTGGLLTGCVVLLRGTVTTGMTTLAYRTLACAQGAGCIIAYIDCADTFDGEYATRQCQVNLEKLLLIQPKDMYQAVSIARDVLTLPYRGLVVFDAGITQEPNLPLLATVVEQLRATIRQTGWVLLILLPLHMTLEIDRAVHIHLRVQRLEWIRQDDIVQGYRALVTVVKNTFHPSEHTAQFEVFVEE